MSESKSINSFFGSLPPASDPNNVRFVAADASGNTSCVNGSQLLRLNICSIPPNGVVRISPISNLLITLRGYNGWRAAFLWASSYNDGQKHRTASKIFHTHESYEYYTNGASDSINTMYIKNINSDLPDSCSIVSLSNANLDISVVDSVPADATPFSQNSWGGG